MLLLLCFILYLRAISKCKPPGAYVLRGQVMEGLLCYEFEELIHGGALIIVILQHGNICKLIKHDEFLCLYQNA